MASRFRASVVPSSTCLPSSSRKMHPLWLIVCSLLACTLAWSPFDQTSSRDESLTNQRTSLVSRNEKPKSSAPRLGARPNPARYRETHQRGSRPPPAVPMAVPPAGKRLRRSVLERVATAIEILRGKDPHSDYELISIKFRRRHPLERTSDLEDDIHLELYFVQAVQTRSSASSPSPVESSLDADDSTLQGPDSPRSVYVLRTTDRPGRDHWQEHNLAPRPPTKAELDFIKARRPFGMEDFSMGDSHVGLRWAYMTLQLHLSPNKQALLHQSLLQGEIANFEDGPIFRQLTYRFDLAGRGSAYVGISAVTAPDDGKSLALAYISRRVDWHRHYA